MRKHMLIIPCFLLILCFASFACAIGKKSEGIPVVLDSPWAVEREFDQEWDGNIVFSCNSIEGTVSYANLSLSEGEMTRKIELYPGKGVYLDRMGRGELQVLNSNEVEYFETTTPRTGDRGIMPYVIIAAASMVIIIALMIKKQIDSHK